MTAFIQVTGLAIRAPGGRTLLDSLDLRLPPGRVALVGRNGIGRSTLLSVLAGSGEAHAGRVATSSQPHFVPQLLARPAACGFSHGEQRRRALAEAKASRAEVVLLDEPSEESRRGGAELASRLAARVSRLPRSFLSNIDTTTTLELGP